MPFGSVRLIPGVNVERTPALLEAGYVTATFSRFRDGLWEKLGGWMRFYNFAVGGIPRSLHAWQDFNGVNRLGVGSTTILGVITSGALTDITPQTVTFDSAVNVSTVSSSTTVTIIDSNVSTPTIYDSVYFNTPIAVGGIVLSGSYPIAVVTGTTSYQIIAAMAATATVNNGGAVPDFTTTSGSAVVAVTIAAHNLVAGNAVNFPIATTVGGVTVSGTYTVSGITSSSVFTITVSNQASSSTSAYMNSGNGEIVYYIAVGPTLSSTGWGVGTYGSGGWGTGQVNSSQTGTKITPSDWTTDNFGNDIVACPAGGGIYHWNPYSGFQNAALVSTVPMFNTAAFVAMPAQILVGLGSTADETISANGLQIGSAQNPLLVRWSDQENFTSWIPTATNQAGSYLVPTGSLIVGGFQASQTALIWTDIDVYSMTYIGGTGLVFAFNKLAAGCGLIGKHAMCQLGSTVYWASQSNFFKLDGNGVSPMPCPVWDSVFQQIDTANLAKCVMGANEVFNEVWFAFPVKGGSGENSVVVKMNTLDGTWTDPSAIARSAWIGQSVLGYPIGASPSGLIYQHENGYSNDGAAILASFTTGYFRIAEGEEYSFVDRLYPDFKWGTYGSGGASINLTVYATNYAGDTAITFGPYTVTQATEYVPVRIRARLMAFSASSNDNYSFERLGRVGYRYAPQGRR